jgi:hypothetical protein
MRLIKWIAKAILPARVWLWLRERTDEVRLLLRIGRNYFYDYRRFIRWSADRSKTRSNVAALITMDYHRIEKALALRDPRPGFGGWFIPRLIENIARYRADHGLDRNAEVAINALSAYERFNAWHGVLLQPVAEAVKAFDTWRVTAGDRCGEGGTRHVSAEDLLQSSLLDLYSFFSRPDTAFANSLPKRWTSASLSVL